MVPATRPRRDGRDAARGARKRPVTVVKFPCGHGEPEADAARRYRHSRGAVWVACRRCNLTVLATG